MLIEALRMMHTYYVDQISEYVCFLPRKLGSGPSVDNNCVVRSRAKALQVHEIIDHGGTQTKTNVRSELFESERFK